MVSGVSLVFIKCRSLIQLRILHSFRKMTNSVYVSVLELNSLTEGRVEEDKKVGTTIGEHA